MYAVIKSGGKQHRVVEGETLRLEKLDVATGESIDFDEVLMVGEGAKVKIGAPTVKGGKVTAEVMALKMEVEHLTFIMQSQWIKWLMHLI